MTQKFSKAILFRECQYTEGHEKRTKVGAVTSLPNVFNFPLQVTAKHLAAGFSSSSVVNLILDENADVNVLDGDGYTPLHYAAQYNDVEVVSMIEEGGRQGGSGLGRGRT